MRSDLTSTTVRPPHEQGRTMRRSRRLMPARKLELRNSPQEASTSYPHNIPTAWSINKVDMSSLLDFREDVDSSQHVLYGLIRSICLRCPRFSLALY